MQSQVFASSNSPTLARQHQSAGVRAQPRLAHALSRQAPALNRTFRTQTRKASKLVVTHARNVNQERGTKQSLKSEKQSRNPNKGVKDRQGEADQFLGSSSSYLLLAALNAFPALPLALAPHSVAEFLFAGSALPHDALHEPLLRILALGFAGSSAAAASLSLAAKRGRLGESPFQRLNLALLAATSFTGLLALSNAATAGEGSVISYNGFWTSLPALGATVLTAWGGYGKSSEVGLSLKRVGPLPAVKKYQDDVADLPDNKSSLASTVYSLLTIALVGAGAAYLLSPEPTLEAFFNNAKGEECVFTWRAVGGGLVTLLPAVTYTLREAAQKGQLGQSPFKALNIGIFGAGAGHLAVLTPILLAGEGGPFLPALLGVWGLAAGVSGANLFQNGSE